MGYTSSSKRADFHDITNRVNQVAQVYFPREINMGNYDQANNWAAQSANDQGNFMKADNKKTYSYYDLFKEDGKDNKNVTGVINGVAYDPSHPDKLAVSITNKKGTNVYYANPAIFGMQTQNLVKSYSTQVSGAIKDRDYDQVNDLANLLMRQLIMVFNSYTPAKSRTSSNP